MSTTPQTPPTSQGNEKTSPQLAFLSAGAFYIEIAKKREANEKFIAAWFDSRVKG